MEHIVQFGVTIDDNAIQKNVEKQAAELVLKSIKDELGMSQWSNRSPVIKRMVDEHATKFFEDNKDEIIKLASDKLVEKLARTKAVKEATQKVVDEVFGDSCK